MFARLARREDALIRRSPRDVWGRGAATFSATSRSPPSLRELDHVVLAPHIASATEETIRALGACGRRHLRELV